MSSEITERSDETTDWAVLASLLADDRAPWSIEEVAREVGDHTETIDSLQRLHRAGLIHRCEGFVFTTRAARRFEDLRS